MRYVGSGTMCMWWRDDVCAWVCKAVDRQRVKTRASETTNKERIYPTRSHYTLFTIEGIESYSENKRDGGRRCASGQQILDCLTWRSKRGRGSEGSFNTVPGTCSLGSVV